MNCRPAVIGLTCTLLLMLAGCAAPAPQADLHSLLPTPLLLLGEQHDAPQHQALQRDTVRQLAAQGALAAVVLEMVVQGRETTGLPPQADEAQVRDALDWRQDRNAGAWPWSVYGPVIMEAVRAGVPVLGGNLPRDRMRTVMSDASLDNSLPPAALERQRQAIRSGHCDLLPESQITPMTRIQIARDQSMAATAMGAMKPGQTVLLIAGNGHVQRDLGIPRHLSASVPHRVVMTLAGAADGITAADRVWTTPATPPKDHCAELRRPQRPSSDMKM